MAAPFLDVANDLPFDMEVSVGDVGTDVVTALGAEGGDVPCDDIIRSPSSLSNGAPIN
jgi:hypothetical protein